MQLSEYANKIGIRDLAEISMLENFFQNPEMKQELQEAEKWRIRRYFVLIPAILLTIVGISYFASLGSVQVEIGDTNTYRPSTVYDGMLWSLFAIIFVFGIVTSAFRSHIEWAIKEKVLTKLSKELYSGLEYDAGQKYAFWDIGELRSKWFLHSYDRIDTIEDSLGFKAQKDGKHIVVQGYELKTSEVRGSGKNRKRVTTNHCYLLKVRFPQVRIPLTNDLFIRTDEADSVTGSLGYALIGGCIGGFIGIFLSEFSGMLAICITLIGVAIGYFWRRSYIDTHRVKLENLEFEKLFDVQCEDQVTSRMIVTPAFMDRLVTLAKQSNYRYELLYRSNCFYIKWNIRSSYLEVNTWKNMTTNVTTFLDWYLQMREILSFIFDMRMMYFSKTDTALETSDMILEYERMGDMSLSIGKSWNPFSFFPSAKILTFR